MKLKVMGLLLAMLVLAMGCSAPEKENSINTDTVSTVVSGQDLPNPSVSSKPDAEKETQTDNHTETEPGEADIAALSEGKSLLLCGKCGDGFCYVFNNYETGMREGMVTDCRGKVMFSSELPGGILAGIEEYRNSLVFYTIDCGFFEWNYVEGTVKEFELPKEIGSEIFGTDEFCFLPTKNRLYCMLTSQEEGVWTESLIEYDYESGERKVVFSSPENSDTMDIRSVAGTFDEEMLMIAGYMNKDVDPKTGSKKTCVGVINLSDFEPEYVVYDYDRAACSKDTCYFFPPFDGDYYGMKEGIVVYDGEFRTENVGRCNPKDVCSVSGNNRYILAYSAINESITIYDAENGLSAEKHCGPVLGKPSLSGNGEYFAYVTGVFDEVSGRWIPVIHIERTDSYEFK